MFRSLFVSTTDKKVFAIPLDEAKYSEEELKAKFIEACNEFGMNITEKEVELLSVKNIVGNHKKIPFVCKECDKGIVLENWTMESWLKIKKLQKCG